MSTKLKKKRRSVSERVATGLAAFIDWFIWTVDVGPSMHRIFLAPNIGNFRVEMGKIRAVRLYRHAAKKVPAYKDFLKKHDFVGPYITTSEVTLNDLPEMDKASYIKPYSLVDKLYDAKLPKTGIMFDESSGSSGTPTSWVRGRKERRFTQRIMQVAFREYIDKRSPIVINTFSMGAWATGLNTTISLLGVGRVKSIGPDIRKVIDTLNELGSDFDYAIAGYPPFLKQLADSKEIDWSKFRISAIYGGEGISEAMRDTLLEKYSDVVGSYGASDLEINIGHETPFSIALRKAIIQDKGLREALLKQNRGIIPMIFQYNPYDYLMETNEKGELVITICRLQNLSPRIRYNIHDLGHVMDFYELKKTLKAYGHADLLKHAELDFAVMFHYGRSDLSVDYNGAVVGPEEVKQIINSKREYADRIEGFRLISYEDAEAHKHLLIAIELEEGAKMPKADSDALLAHIVASLQDSNLDFKSAHRTSPLKPELRVYEYHTGIFDAQHQKLKNDYVWNIDHKRAVDEGILKK